MAKKFFFFFKPQFPFKPRHKFSYTNDRTTFFILVHRASKQQKFIIPDTHNCVILILILILISGENIKRPVQVKN